MAYTLLELADILAAKLQGDPACIISGVAPLDKANAGDISFLTDRRYQDFLTITKASAIIVAYGQKLPTGINCLLMANPYLGYAKVMQLLYPLRQSTLGIHPSAVIGKNCKLLDVSIGANCVIGDNVTIGAGTVIYGGCIIGDDVAIGKDSILHANATVYHKVQLGDKVIVHSGAVIGSDGFGFAKDDKGWVKIPQVGKVIIGNDVEIGANTTIDRGALENTIIEDGVKLDNLIHIAHNVYIGAYTIIAACTAISGSTHIGKNCKIGGNVGFADHIAISDNVTIIGKSLVTQSIAEPGIYASTGRIQSHKEWKKSITRFCQLDDIARRLTKLEKTDS